MSSSVSAERLRSRWAELTAKRAFTLGVPLAVVGLQLAVIVMLTTRHEYWRDEMRALSVVKEHPNPIALFHGLKNEGHPMVWYLVLLVGWTVSHSNYTLTVASIAIAAAASWVFLRRAPFPMWQRALFVFGNLMIYEYAVMARNYGCATLMLFGVAAVFPRRYERPVTFGLIVAVAANTAGHVAPLVLGLLVGLAWEVVITSRCRTPGGLRPRAFLGRDGRAWLVITGIVLAGVGFALFTSLPDKNSIVTKLHERTVDQLLPALRQFLVEPGKLFGPVLGEEPGILNVQTLAFWAIASCFLGDGPLFVWFMVGSAGLSLIFQLGYHAAGIRHNGVFFMFIVSLLWIRLTRLTTSSAKLARVWRTLILVLFAVLCVDQLHVAKKWIRKDQDRVLSSSPDLGAYLNSRPELAKAIVVGEPDFLLESLPYYANNDVYLAREDRFGKYALFTTASKPNLTLSQILATARRLKTETERRVLIVMATSMKTDGRRAFSRRYSYNRRFEYSSKELGEFQAATTQLARFEAPKADENFIVYDVK